MGGATVRYRLPIQRRDHFCVSLFHQRNQKRPGNYTGPFDLGSGEPFRRLT